MTHRPRLGRRHEHEGDVDEGVEGEARGEGHAVGVRGAAGEDHQHLTTAAATTTDEGVFLYVVVGVESIAEQGERGERRAMGRTGCSDLPTVRL